MKTRLAPVQEASAALSAPRGWIISPSWDTFLFIGAPLVAIASFLPLRAYFTSQTISVALLAFFTFGHHLPGFLRAYGDSDLFARYRWRFLIAPPLIFCIALWSSFRDLHGLLLIVFTWDIWHVLMQQYGFLRIYDAKLGNTQPSEARLDLAVSLSWYLFFIASSPYYVHDLLYRAYSAGVPALASSTIQNARTGLLALTTAIMAAYIFHHFRRWRENRLNVRKIAALAIFLAATYYLYVVLEDFLIGFAVWSAFHCIQYYGIVWSFNQRRALQNPRAAGGFLTFLFRPRLANIVLYLAMIFAYGAFNWLTTAQLAPQYWRELLAALIVTSGTLHYYYDGFIWKLHEGRTRPGTFQAATACVALLALTTIESAHPSSNLGIRQALASALPGVAAVHLNLGDALRQAGQPAKAIESYRRAAELKPENQDAWHRLGLSFHAAGRKDEAVSAFNRVLQLDGGHREAHYNLAVLLAGRGESERAMHHFDRAYPANDPAALRAVEREPGAADLFNNLALGQLQAGRRDAALSLFHKAVAIDPNHASARLNIGNLLIYAQRYAEAEPHLRKAIAVEPRNPMAHNTLGHLLARTERPEEARRHLEFALSQNDDRVRVSAAQGLRLISLSSTGPRARP